MNKKNKNKYFLIFIVFSNLLYLSWRLIFTMPTDAGILVLILAVFLLMSEATSVFTAFVLFWSQSKSWNLELPIINEDDYPEVDIFIATHNESYDLLYKTVNACTYLKYPDLSKVHIHICDDNNRKEIQNLAEELKVNYIGLKNNTQAKSGNLNNALSKTSAPLIATFDADMIPYDTFLIKTVPYFLLNTYNKDESGKWFKLDQPNDTEIGFIQTPQNFYNPDLFHFNLMAENKIPNEQDFFTREVNTSNNAMQAPIYTGSNTVISRKAIEKCGGFPTNTITEDFQLGVEIQSHGFTSFATEEILAAGLTPDKFSDVKKQRIRWARGVIQSVYNVKLLTNKGLSTSQKIVYFTSYLYWWSFFRRIMYIIAPILFTLFSIRLVDNNYWLLLLFWMPAYFSLNYYMQHFSGRIRTQRWGEFYETILAPFMVIPVLKESLGIRENKFVVTNKSKIENKKKFEFSFLPHILLFILSILGFIKFNYNKSFSELLYGSVINFWIIHHIINLSYSLIFAFERVLNRQESRIFIEENVKIPVYGHQYSMKTIDLSEAGIRTWASYNLQLEIGKIYEIELYNETYKTKIKSKLLRIKNIEGTYLYSFKHESISDIKQYLQLIYTKKNTQLPLYRDVWFTEMDSLIDVFRSKINFNKSEIEEINRLLDMRIGKKKLSLIDDFYFYFDKDSQSLERFDNIEIDGFTYSLSKRLIKHEKFDIYKILSKECIS